MPSGRTHEAINLAALGGLATAYRYAELQGWLSGIAPLVTPESVGLFTASYLVGTFLVTPDLDLAENRVRAKSNWGLLGLLWVPYGAMFSHRGLSHSWLVGPLTRLIYLAAVALALSWLAAAAAPLFGYRFSVQAQLGENWRELALGALAGYYLSQWLHLIADGIRPDHGLTRMRRKRARR